VVEKMRNKARRDAAELPSAHDPSLGAGREIPRHATTQGGLLSPGTEGRHKQDKNWRNNKPVPKPVRE